MKNIFKSRFWCRFVRLVKRIDAAVTVTARVVSIVAFVLKAWDLLGR